MALLVSGIIETYYPLLGKTKQKYEEIKHYKWLI
jgi:hypothetical protein